ncbi:MAG: sugar phosphate isomerase/epimerase [Clostridia bacterium]|nr:sugar phosphate isomerase/epimerase [Clostridia bacterium]
MYQFPIGVMVNSFKQETHDAIRTAAKIGAKGLQITCTKGERAPENFTKEARRELLDFVRSQGLCFSAVCGDLGHGFGDPELNPELIEKSKRIMDVAKDLGTDIVTTHIGVVPEDPDHPRYRIMQEACYELAQYADSIGSRFAVETGPETAVVLKNFLDSLGSKGVSVNLDPANLCMVTGDDPVAAVYTLKDYIVHTHAKDGNLLVKGNPEYIYRVVHPVPETAKGIRYFEEVPLGTGSVPFPAYLKALEDIGYRGYLTIEREVGANPVADIKTAYDHLTKVMAEN